MLQAIAVTPRRIVQVLPSASALSRSASTASSSSKMTQKDASSAHPEGEASEEFESTKDESREKTPEKKTFAEADEELRQKLEAMSGEGGEAGLELEGGKPVTMKRGVRENMFRYI